MRKIGTRDPVVAQHVSLLAAALLVPKVGILRSRRSGTAHGSAPDETECDIHEKTELRLHEVSPY
jgi:hypothetical protein